MVVDSNRASQSGLPPSTWQSAWLCWKRIDAAALVGAVLRQQGRVGVKFE